MIRLQFADGSYAVDVDIPNAVVVSPGPGGLKIVDAKTGDTIARLDLSTMMWTLGAHPVCAEWAPGPWPELEIL